MNPVGMWEPTPGASQNGGMRPLGMGRFYLEECLVVECLFLDNPASYFSIYLSNDYHDHDTMNQSDLYIIYSSIWTGMK